MYGIGWVVMMTADWLLEFGVFCLLISRISLMLLLAANLSVYLVMMMVLVYSKYLCGFGRLRWNE